MSSTEGEVFTMFTASHRALLLRAHKALEARIKFTNGGLTALGCSSPEVKRVELQAVELKNMLDAAHDRDGWTYDSKLRDVGAHALAILADALDKVRKTAVSVGVEDPHDIDDAIELSKTIGRQLRADLFPLPPKQGDLLDEEDAK